MRQLQTDGNSLMDRKFIACSATRVSQSNLHPDRTPFLTLLLEDLDATNKLWRCNTTHTLQLCNQKVK